MNLQDERIRHLCEQLSLLAVAAQYPAPAQQAVQDEASSVTTSKTSSRPNANCAVRAPSAP